MILAVVFCLTLLLAFPSLAASTYRSELSEARLVSDVSEYRDGSFWLAVHLKPKPGWHTYWQNPGDSGIPTTIEWTRVPQGLGGDKLGPIHWPAPERIKTGDLTNYGYDGEAYLLVPAEALSWNETPKEISYTAKVSWLVCKDICVPETATLDLAIPVGTKNTRSADAPAIERWLKRVPSLKPLKGSYGIDGSHIGIEVPLAGIPKILSADFFPVKDGIVSNSAHVQLNLSQDRILFATRAGTIPPGDPFPVVFALKAAEGTLYRHAELAWTRHPEGAIATEGSSPAPSNGSFAPLRMTGGGDTPTPTPDMSLSLALLFALLGGLALNVMPCVLPILSLKALSLTRHAHPRAEALAYTAGVLACFAAMAGALIAIQQAGALAGWGFQLQSPGFVTALVYVMFAVGLSLSGFFSLQVFSGGSALTSKAGAAGSFFTGALAALVATPCTAPFMAPAVGFALTQPPLAALSVFLALGLGMALPFLAIGFFPAFQRLLPKPGAWMDTFKQFLAFPMYATAVWLLWVLARQAGAAGVTLALSGCVGIAFAVWLGKVTSSHRWAMLLLLALGLAFTVTMQTGERACVSPTAMQEEGIASEPFSQARLDALLKQGKPVFVNATADWCITCKFNERIALSSDAVKRALRERRVTVLVADWTHQDDAITAYLESFGRRGVPLYVFYAPGKPAQVLPQILTPSTVTDALKAIDAR